MDYDLLDSDTQAGLLRDKLRSLESEHYGITHNFSAVAHAVVHEEGETSDEALKRFYAQRLPEIETEVKKLRKELKALEDGKL